MALSTAEGVLHARMGFDPWGQRRDPEQVQVPWLQWVAPGASPFHVFAPPHWALAMLRETPRGYTGHEHLDAYGIIHMNGRIYDPNLARFLQADPFMEDTGTLNRYTYVLNNPLMYNDPSGYMFDSPMDFFKTLAVIAIAVHMPTALAPMLGELGAVIATGALAGFVSTGTVEGAFLGAVSAAAFYGIGTAFEHFASSHTWMQGSALGSELSGPALALKFVSHGLAGGILSQAQGGKFSHGFVSAGVT